MGPREIEELITIPLERALASTPGIKEMTSRSSEGTSRVRVSFEWGVDLDAGAEELRARIDRIRGQLPEDADPPTLYKYDLSIFPIMFLGVSSEMPPRELREFAEKQIQYRFERIPGVAQADIWGGLEREIHVVMDRAKMHTLRISPAQVMAALRRENLNEPAGHVIEDTFEVLMRTEGEYASMDEIRRTMVTIRQGTPIYVEDIATVEDSHQEIRHLVRVNGVPGIRMGRPQAVRRQHRPGGAGGGPGHRKDQSGLSAGPGLFPLRHVQVHQPGGGQRSGRPPSLVRSSPSSSSWCSCATSAAFWWWPSPSPFRCWPPSASCISAALR